LLLLFHVARKTLEELASEMEKFSVFSYLQLLTVVYRRKRAFFCRQLYKIPEKDLIDPSSVI
jgi:hypothetical protein